MKTLSRIALWITLAVIVLTACNFSAATPSPTAIPTPTTIVEPKSKIRLVENHDGVKNVYTTSHDGGYDDISLEDGLAEVQLLCTIKQTITFHSANKVNSKVTLTDCPELEAGVAVQIVSTSTDVEVTCENCTITTQWGEMEYGVGINAWRGTIRISKKGGGEAALVLTPVKK